MSVMLLLIGCQAVRQIVVLLSENRVNVWYTLHYTLSNVMAGLQVSLIPDIQRFYRQHRLNSTIVSLYVLLHILWYIFHCHW